MHFLREGFVRKMDKKLDKWIENELNQTVKNIQASPQLYFKIKNQVRLQEERNMKKNLFTSKKAKSLVVLGALCVMSLTCYGAMKLTGYESHSSVEFSSFPTVSQVEKKVDFAPKFVEVFSNGFAFENASVGAMAGVDDDFNHVTEEQKMVTFNYKKDGDFIAISNRLSTEEIPEDYTGMESIDVNGVTMYYSSDEYKFFPPDQKPSEEDLELERQGKLYISYGSAEVEEQTIQSLFWKEDGILYEMTALDVDISQEGLVEMAKEVMAQ